MGDYLDTFLGWFIPQSKPVPKPPSPPPLPQMPSQPVLAAEPAVILEPALPDAPRAPKGGSRHDRAVDVYEKNGSVSYDLNNRKQIQQLLANTPQIDNLDSTQNDKMRCVGSSMVALALLDGDPKSNATALLKTAQDYGTPISAEQRAAIKSMSEGHLTPSEAAQLGEMSWDAAGRADKAPNPVGRGATAYEAGAAMSALRSNGGLTHLSTASINNEVQSSTQHATATAVDSKGRVVSYDPWPQENGQAKVTNKDMRPDQYSDLASRTSIQNGSGGQAALVTDRAVDAGGNYRVAGNIGDEFANKALETHTQPLAPGQVVDPNQVFTGGEKTYRDPRTGKPLTAEEARKIEAAQANPQDAIELYYQNKDSGGMEAPPPPADPRLTVTYHKTTGVQVGPLQTDATGNVVSKEVRAEKSALEKQVSYQSKHVQAQAGVKVGEVAAYAGASTSVNLKNLKINAEVHAGVEANVVDAQASAKIKLGNISDLGGDARARVGADAVGEAGVGFDPKRGTIEVGASGEAFTGARANAGVNLNIGPVGGHAGVALQAGVGVQAGVDVGLKNGKLHFGLDIGFSLGIGIRFNLGFTIDFKAIGKGIVDGVKAIGKGLKKLGKAMAKGAKKMKKAAKKAVKWMGKTAKKGLNKLKKLGKKVGKKLKKVGKKVGKKLKKLFGRRKRKKKNKVSHKAEVKHPKAPKKAHAKLAIHPHMKALKAALHKESSSFECVA